MASVNGKKAFTAVELMDGLHKSIFAVTERGGLPDVMTRNLQKGFVDALINNGIIQTRSLFVRLSFLSVRKHLPTE